MCDCVDRLSTFEATDSFIDDDNHKCFMNNGLLSETKRATGVFHKNKPSLRFVVPVKHKTVNIMNEHLISDEDSARMNMARPIVMQALTRTQSLSGKCSCTSSNLKLPDLRWICSIDKSTTDELSCSSLEVIESLVTDSASDCTITKDSVELSVSVTGKDMLPQQQSCTDVDISNDVAVISHTSDVGKHSSLRYLSEKVVDTLEKHNELSFAKDSVRTQRLFCKDNQLKRIASKSILKNVQLSPGSLLTLRSIDDCNRLSLKDAVRGNRPFTYSLMEVAF